jgi:hypothetical protein
MRIAVGAQVLAMSVVTIAAVAVGAVAKATARDTSHVIGGTACFKCQDTACDDGSGGACPAIESCHRVGTDCKRVRKFSNRLCVVGTLYVECTHTATGICVETLFNPCVADPALPSCTEVYDTCGTANDCNGEGPCPPPQ